MRITPLDAWARGITGEDLRAYRLESLNRTLRVAREASFYRERLPERVCDLSGLRALPTMCAKDLEECGSALVCVPQREISRIVTLRTSGSTGRPKRVYFTEEDQELTVDYFANGLTLLASPGESMGVLLPCESVGGVGELICRAIRRIPVSPVPYGMVRDLAECASVLAESEARSLVGIPVQALALARFCHARGIKLDVKKILLSTDSIPRIIAAELKRIWGCEIYEHYGMTEMGLGCAIDCEAHEGYHIRENDLLLEVLGEDGEAVPDGEYGELAFTTLTRRGMPFIRYRTGDISAILPGTCACGSELRRISPIAGRVGADVCMACGAVLKQREFDEVLFALPEVCNFMLLADCGGDSLTVEVETQRSVGDISAGAVARALEDAGLTEGLKVAVSVICRPDVLMMNHGAKRLIKRRADKKNPGD